MESKDQRKNILIVRARHFYFANFGDNKHCPCSRAAADQFNTPQVFEMINKIRIGDKQWLHRPYTIRQFKFDMAVASNLNFNDTIIREIPLLLDEGPIVPYRTLFYRDENLVVSKPYKELIKS